ncbi:MAG TPA: MBL fold metallo-hydrolase [Firmicutes bacterium]|jgi:hydroxyacylglutathione hydrolase|nr:MBL fold metallo-hydrolase [Bacillota bacterium]HHT42359.1 MBL fold metallo-hydrolase [Bacillota bacterium]
MQIESFALNALSTNCYVVYDSGEAVIVDPGDQSQAVLDFLEDKGLSVVAVVNTHGHSDHIHGNAWLLEKTGAPLAIHEDDAAFLVDPALHLGPQIRMDVVPTEAQRLLRDGDRIVIGSGSLEVLHTPGHTPGGICLYGHGLLISGDTLFKRSVGRWDLPGADERALQDSLRRLAKLPPETKVFPGHGPSTTLGEELESNPFLTSL